MYCDNDVKIDRCGTMAFRDVFIGETGIDPITEAITIASACNRVYRTHFLEPNVIGLIPPGGYRRAEKQSAIAIQ